MKPREPQPPTSSRPPQPPRSAKPAGKPGGPERERDEKLFGRLLGRALPEVRPAAKARERTRAATAKLLAERRATAAKNDEELFREVLGRGCPEITPSAEAEQRLKQAAREALRDRRRRARRMTATFAPRETHGAGGRRRVWRTAAVTVAAAAALLALAAVGGFRDYLFPAEDSPARRCLELAARMKEVRTVADVTALRNDLTQAILDVLSVERPSPELFYALSTASYISFLGKEEQQAADLRFLAERLTATAEKAMAEEASDGDGGGTAAGRRGGWGGWGEPAYAASVLDEARAAFRRHDYGRVRKLLKDVPGAPARFLYGAALMTEGQHRSPNDSLRLKGIKVLCRLRQAPEPWCLLSVALVPITDLRSSFERRVAGELPAAADFLVKRGRKDLAAVLLFRAGYRFCWDFGRYIAAESLYRRLTKRFPENPYARYYATAIAPYLQRWAAVERRYEPCRTVAERLRNLRSLKNRTALFRQVDGAIMEATAAKRPLPKLVVALYLAARAAFSDQSRAEKQQLADLRFFGERIAAAVPEAVEAERSAEDAEIAAGKHEDRKMSAARKALTAENFHQVCLILKNDDRPAARFLKAVALSAAKRSHAATPLFDSLRDAPVPWSLFARQWLLGHRWSKGRGRPEELPAATAFMAEHADRETAAAAFFAVAYGRLTMFKTYRKAWGIFEQLAATYPDSPYARHYLEKMRGEVVAAAQAERKQEARLNLHLLKQ